MAEHLQKSPYNHTEQVSRDRAWHLAQAAHDMGGISIKVLASEGETFVSSRQFPENQPRVNKVSPGNTAVHITGSGVEVEGPTLHERADRLQHEAAHRNSRAA